MSEFIAILALIACPLGILICLELDFADVAEAVPSVRRGNQR